MKRASIVNGPIDPAALIAEVQATQFGATSVFLGTVRDTNDGRSVRSIDYTAYTAMAESEMADILGEAATQFNVTAIVVEHRVGPLALGEVSIAVVSAHAHRAPAIECTGFVVDEIKKRVPIWKLEHYIDGGRHWVEPTQPEGAIGP